MKRNGLWKIFSYYKKSELLEIAKLHHLNGYSKYKKEQLCEILAQRLLDKEVMEHYLLFANDEILELLNDRQCKMYLDFDDETYDYLAAGGYAGLYIEGFERVVDVPKEVKDVYRTCCKREWRAERRKARKILAYLNASVCLYGVSPIEKAMEWYYRDTGNKKEYLEIFHFAEQVPENQKAFVVKNKQLILKELVEDKVYQLLLEAQGDKPFYEPTVQEIECLAEEGGLPFDRHLNRLKAFFIMEDEEEENAEVLCRMIEYIIRTGGTMQSVMDCLETEFDNFESVFGNERLMQKFIDRLRDVWNHTRMLSNRGFQPSELVEVKKPQTHSNKDNIIAFPVNRT